MKKSSFGNSSRNSHGMSGVMEFVPINRVVDYFQNAIVNFQLFGLGTGAVVSVALLVSLFSYWTHPGAEKGVL
jgi:hypothetical protein